MSSSSNPQLTHLSLFSGIGGLDLAAEWAGFTTVGQCEFAEFPYRVLKKHWPQVPKWRDVRHLDAAQFFAATGCKSPTLVSGGFPCQPHSIAGKRAADRDERNLWPQFLRVIREVRPRWVLAENVPGILSSDDGRFFGNMLTDLASLGFNVAWTLVSAAAVGAPHRRERLALVAYSGSIRHQGLERLPQNLDPAGAGLKSLHRAAAQFHDGTDWETWARESFFLGKNDGFPHRMDSVKALGNAVVPQQFLPFFLAIAQLESSREFCQ